MSKAETKKQARRVLSILEPMMKTLFPDYRHDIVVEEEPNEDDPQTLMMTRGSNEYMRVLIIIYPMVVAGVDDEELFDSIIHELVHAVHAPVQRWAETSREAQLVEHVTTRQVLMIKKLLKHHRKDLEKAGWL